MIDTQACDYRAAVRVVHDPAALAAAVRPLVLGLNRGLPVWIVQAMKKMIGQFLSRARFMLFLITVFAGLACLPDGYKSSQGCRVDSAESSRD
jgi:hypothetical protein